MHAQPVGLLTTLFGHATTAGRREQKFAHANTYVKEKIRMATATRREVTKTRMVPETYTERDGVTLQLSDDEASYLMALVGWCVVGDGSLRLMNAEIYKALQDHGFDYYSNARTKAMASKMRGQVEIRG